MKWIIIILISIGIFGLFHASTTRIIGASSVSLTFTIGLANNEVMLMAPIANIVVKACIFYYTSFLRSPKAVIPPRFITAVKSIKQSADTN